MNLSKVTRGSPWNSLTVDGMRRAEVMGARKRQRKQNQNKGDDLKTWVHPTKGKVEREEGRGQDEVGGTSVTQHHQRQQLLL